jgi:hypothetical protein
MLQKWKTTLILMKKYNTSCVTFMNTVSLYITISKNKSLVPVSTLTSVEYNKKDGMSAGSTTTKNGTGTTHKLSQHVNKIYANHKHKQDNRSHKNKKNIVIDLQKKAVRRFNHNN